MKRHDKRSQVLTPPADWCFCRTKHTVNRADTNQNQIQMSLSHLKNCWYINKQQPGRIWPSEQQRLECKSVCICEIRAELQSPPQSSSSICVAPFWPEQMCLTLSHSTLTEHITGTVTHIYLVAARLTQCFIFFFIPTRWAAQPKLLGRLNRGDQEPQNSLWECFTHSAPPKRFFFSSCVRAESSDLQSTFSLLWSLGSRLSLPHFWQWWYYKCERSSTFLYSVSSFFSPFACLSPFHSRRIFFFFAHRQATDQNEGVSLSALCQRTIIFMDFENIIISVKGFCHHRNLKGIMSVVKRGPDFRFLASLFTWILH